MNSKNMRPIEIVLVEDNPGDIVLTQEAFSEAKVLNNLKVLRDGEEALAYLNKEGQYQDMKKPDLIFLDLNLPKVDGREVLEFMKSSEHLKDLPVVVLTGSDADHDILKAYDLNVNSYMVKPLNLEQFVNVINSVESFGFSVVSTSDG
ncbi:response regulator [Vibrio sp. S4M6]|uniref:response regulator n=1 Tax=Vibrio sinus TaxID=2946865 RepID=UPI00202AAD77|nr:response regulator [Vibrio sinus]MCL9783333.1 response regulator [Vibrio sinus]